MKHRVVSAWVLFGTIFIGLSTQAEAVTTVEEFEFNFRGKVWCPSASDPNRGEFFNFNETNTKTKIRAGIEITRDPSGTGDLTNLQAELFNRPGGSDPIPPEFVSITMHGLGLLANNSGNSAEFVLHGVNGTDSNVFFTMRGRASLDTRHLINGVPPIKNASGKWIAEAKNTDQNGTPIPGQYCFGDGTFQTGKKLED